MAHAPIAGDVLVDLSACEFIDSSVIGELLEKCEDLRREGCRLRRHCCRASEDGFLD